ncbi:uncharacterized protein FSUBG_2270 [Fusarium subglutinans]|uniref:BTB domain-containing protein n=1 Tax=Gibberella subglutinans TaxID=42677 RepID=A0A8H5QBE8_GIBSU|nr:uncharacterized protein FSUBG_2270 [Fusarium subglutinans]KAF5611437.1 hypothetical protein FSUBG_2270 [Fusarium subglutinans]
MTTIPPPPHSPPRDTRARAAQETAAPNTPTPAPRERSRATSYSSAGYEYRNDNYDYIEESEGISIHAALATLIHSEKFSDMTIICGERQFKTHRAVVCTQSPFFDKAMSGDYKESTSRSIELLEDDPDVVERFLEFLYTGTYSDGTNFTWGKPSKAALLDPETVIQNLQQPACGSQEMDMLSPVEGSDEWVTDDEPDEEYNDYDDRTGSPSVKSDVDEQSELKKVSEAVGEGHCSREEGLKQLAELRNDMTLPLRLYVMADKYDVPALRLLARDRFYRAVELVWEEAECFADVVDELYQTTPPTDTAMREIVCRLVAAVIHVPRVRDKMRRVMMKHGEFAVGVMEYSIHLHTLFASDE